MSTELMLDGIAGTRGHGKELGTFTDDRPPEDAQPGQVWSVTTNRSLPSDACQDGWFFICRRIEDVSGAALRFTAAPLFEGAAYAHDKDAILPSRLLGFSAGIAMEQCLDVDVSLLDRCVASLPETFAVPLLMFYEHLQNPEKVPCPPDASRGLPLFEGMRAARDKFHADLSEELDFLRPVDAFEVSVKDSSRGLRLWLNTDHPGLLPEAPVRVRLDGSLGQQFGERWVFKLSLLGSSIECKMCPDRQAHDPQANWVPDSRAFQFLLRRICPGDGGREGGTRPSPVCGELRLVSGEWTFRVLAPLS